MKIRRSSIIEVRTEQGLAQLRVVDFDSDPRCAVHMVSPEDPDTLVCVQRSDFVRMIDY